MARTSLFLNQRPFTYHSHLQAMDYIRNLPSTEQIERVFFYQDATLVGLKNQQPVQGQPSLAELWQKLASERGFALQNCIANSLRRGIFNDEEAKRYDRQANLADQFELTGLGEMVDAVISSDRIIQFPQGGSALAQQTESTDIDLLIHIATVPTLDLEPLELAMACAAFERQVALIFSGDGLDWLINKQEPKRPGGKAADKLVKALAMYDCDQVYYVVDEEHQLPNATLVNNVEEISFQQQCELVARSKHQLAF